ncbi:hypothetical protein HPB50_017095 [Hyalomma asiaticum]|uniref:Uncharacterized protein n=1 Tax=Hyalomma asiaticum TaxID=266040 RepID=A0ACB7TJ69_HYAAI|nr:hypothetical protein HPB50_017095 [Hyalomma asiaticum]
MAADSADFQRLYTLSRVATNRQQFEAAVTATAAENPENPAATTSQGNLMFFDEGGATHEAHPPAYSVLEGARHITPSPLPEDLDELASEAKRIQANILASRAYRPPPPASQALEPRCAWNGDNFRTRPQGNGLLAFSDERSSSGWELSDRALDPYTHARRAACAADGRDDPACTHSWHGNPLAQSISLVRRLLFAPSMPDNGASRKVKRRWSRNTPPSGLLARRTGGRSSTTSPLRAERIPCPGPPERLIIIVTRHPTLASDS